MSDGNAIHGRIRPLPPYLEPSDRPLHAFIHYRLSTLLYPSTSLCPNRAIECPKQEHHLHALRAPSFPSPRSLLQNFLISSLEKILHFFLFHLPFSHHTLHILPQAPSCRSIIPATLFTMSAVIKLFFFLTVQIFSLNGFISPWCLRIGGVKRGCRDPP